MAVIVMRMIILSFFVLFVNGEPYDTYTGLRISKKRFMELENVGLVPWCAIEVAPCNPKEPRRTDHSCNNLRYPSRGTSSTPYRRVLPAVVRNGQSVRSVSGRELPPVRTIRVAIMSDGRMAGYKHTNMVIYFALLNTGDITTVHDTFNYAFATMDCCVPSRGLSPDCAPIMVPDDDLHLRPTNVRCLNLTTPISYQSLGCVSDPNLPLERINIAAPMLDLSNVYGDEARGAAKGRLGEGGRMPAEMVNGEEWPPSGSNDICINNEPPRETRCHDVPSLGSSNVLLGTNIPFIWFYRQHNTIARELQALNPCWDDDKLYIMAKEINIAFYNQLLYYEFLPQIIDRDYLLKNHVIFNTTGYVDDYDQNLEPSVSIEYVTTTRWFHTVQDGRLNYYNKKGVLYDEKAVVDFSSRTGALAINNTLAAITQGAFRQATAAVDNVIDPDLGERVLGRLQLVSDVLSADIMKGRLLALPSYNQYRIHCNLPHAKTFHDLRQWMSNEQVDALSRHYESVEDIELMVGMTTELSEGPMVPPILACLMVDQLQHWRRSDRFWYEHPDHPQAFTHEQLLEIRKMSASFLMCNHGDSVTRIQPNPFLLPGPGNEIIPCSHYSGPNLRVFADDKCADQNRHTPANPFTK